MSDVNQALQQLIEAIKASDVYVDYHRCLDEVNQESGMKQQIDEFRQKNYSLQNSGDIDLDKLEAFEETYAEFRENPKVSDFLAAELSLCRMIQEIDAQITEALEFDL